MPAGVVGIVSCRASFAVIALAAAGAMQHDLVRPGQPVFIDVKVSGFDRRGGQFADQSRFGSDLLHFGPGIAAHGQHGQAVHFFDPTHHGQHGFHRQGIGLNKVRQHQRQIFPVNAAGRLPVVGESRAGHLRHLARNFVGSHGNNPHAAESDQGKSDGVIAGQYRKSFRNGMADFSHLTDVAAGFLDAGDVRDLGQAGQGAGLNVRAGAARDVIKNDRLVHGFRDGAEVAVLSFLRRLVVVRRCGENAIDPRPGPQLPGLGDRILGRIRSGTGHNRYSPSRYFNRDIENLQPFIMRKRGRFAGGAAGDQKIDARFQLPRDQVAQGSLVDGAVLLEGSDQCRTAATVA